MKTDVTAVMVHEHTLILRMIVLVEKKKEEIKDPNFSDWNFFLDAIDFIRNYADKFHHAKEEDVLFRELVKNGMPEKSSPIEAMLIAHDQGREFVQNMEAAATEALQGEKPDIDRIVTNAEGYIALLREHIKTEDTILYPLAERVLPEEVRSLMLKDYEAAETAAGSDFEKHYETLVKKYEHE